MRRIFVSATTRDLGSYRQLASQSLRKRGYDVDDQAIFNLTYLEIGETAQAADRRVRRRRLPDRLRLRRRAVEPPGRSAPRSYTQWEYFLARELKKPVYLLLADEKTPFDPDARMPLPRTGKRRAPATPEGLPRRGHPRSRLAVVC